MSLKFGIYLVEQRVISAEQFCGLVKIQQEAAKTMATISLRKNLMTIKQVNHLLNLLEGMPDMTFERLALEKGMIDAQDLEIMRNSKEVSCPPIRRLLVECGLLTQHQTKVLFEHFEKIGTAGIQHQTSATPMRKPNISKPASPAQQPAPTASAMPQPKFQQRRPVIVRQQTK